ncbi:MAG: transcription antitermination factor NusB [Kiritimatiellia bacterium]|nr:transcription antitermination factor NusB [Kiritimatiellia bacterium]
MNPRREAVFILARWLESGDFPDRMLTAGPSRAFVQNAVYTAIRNRTALLWILGQHLRRLPSGELLAVLLLGATELLFLECRAPYAAVNEAVGVAKIASRRTAGVVNAVLRRIAEGREELLANLAKQRPSIRFSHPSVLIRRWSEQFGESAALEICRLDNLPAETWLASLDPNAPRRFERLERGIDPAGVPELVSGKAIVQDPATAAAIDLLNIQDGQRILDSCAAPGGKTLQIAVRNPHGQTVAADLHEDRLSALRQNLERTRLQTVEVLRLSADVERPDGIFDRILLDVPCSNTGVLRRRPDARWRWSPARLSKLLERQAAILENTAQALAPQGRLVYSTCSLEPEENQLQVRRFVDTHPGWRLVEERQFLPHLQGHDGAYAAALMRAD